MVFYRKFRAVMVSVRRCYQYWRQYSVLSPAAAWPPPFLLKNISAQSTTRLQILGGVRGVYGPTARTVLTPSPPSSTLVPSPKECEELS